MLKLTATAARYGPIEALHAVSLEVHRGEIVTVLGANGAGKSTTLRLISGLLPLSAGQMQFLDCDLSRLAPEARVSLGIAHVPEGRHVFPGLSVFDNLQVGASARPRTRQLKTEIQADLEMVCALFPDLSRFSRRLAWTLSGGQQQMLAIARGLMSRPQLLLLDEPSLGLAPVLVEQVFAAIERISRAGTTILLVEQNAHMALEIASRGYVLENGRVVLHDTAPNLLSNPKMKEAYLGGEATESTTDATSLA